MRIQVANPNDAALWAELYDSDGQVVLVATGETEEPLDAHVADYAIPLHPSGRTPFWYFELPGDLGADLPAGVYDARVYEQQGGDPASDDPEVEFPASPSRIQWDGEAEAVLAGLIVSVQVTAAQAGSEAGTITALRGDSLSISLTGLGSLTARTKLWFTVKWARSDADTASVIQVTEAGGLLFLNGAAATAGQGSITVNDAATGAVTVALAPAATALLSVARYAWDLQMLTASGVTTLAEGEFAVSADVTRAVS